MRQFVSTIDAIDRPDLTFYTNVIFVMVNLGLNVSLTWQFGWYGAATATTVSSGLGLLLGYHYANQVINVVIPVKEVGKQFLAAGVMAIVVLTGRLFAGDSLLIIIVLVVIGAIVYFSALFVLSNQFRTTIQNNLPFDLTMISD